MEKGDVTCGVSFLFIGIIMATVLSIHTYTFACIAYTLGKEYCEFLRRETGMPLLTFSADKNSETVLALWIAAAGVLITGLAGCLAGLFTPWLLLLAALTGALTVFAALWYPPRYAAALHGSFDGTAVRAVKGVLWKRELYVPASALRTVESGSTPLQRRCHCRTMVLRFAGGAVLLPLLPEEETERLSKALEAVSSDELPPEIPETEQ